MIRLTCCRLILGTPDNATRPYLKFSLNTKEALSKYKESIANQLQSGYMKVIFEYYVQCSRLLRNLNISINTQCPTTFAPIYFL